jgi:ABC-type branched-subunit amino acid transport system ATPase component
MTPAIEVRNLVMRFGGLVATNDLSFHVNEGESLGVIGPNGAGKTTVFSLIMGQLRQTSGDIFFKGQNINTLATEQRIALGLSRTYQVPQPYHDLTVRENIRVGLMPNSLWHMIVGRSDVARETELGEMVGFSVADMERPASELTMGDLRKLEFARTLATGAKVLLLDEVFAGLTSGEIATISALIQDLRQSGFTFLMVSHDLPAMEPLVDRAIAIERGTLLAVGDFKTVLADDSVRASYLGGEV